MVADLATSTGDTLYFDGNLMGGATFYAHLLNTVSQSKIMAGNWDYVVLQGQSLEMFGNFTDILVSHPELATLDSIIRQYNPCAEIMFYRTWGRKNGLGFYTYESMDSSIHVSYMKAADTLNAVVSPVGEVWKNIRQNYPAIELYDPDESHPSLAGSYAAACCFYTAIFRKDATLCSFNSTLPSTDAVNIKYAAKVMVYDSLLNYHIGEYDSLFTNCPGTGIDEIKNSYSELYPNPATATITLSNNLRNHSLLLFNAEGILVKEIENAPSRINIESLPGGLYLLKLKGESKGIKFIKQ